MDHKKKYLIFAGIGIVLLGLAIALAIHFWPRPSSCQTNSDCSNNQICINSSCVAPCTANSCPTGQLCDSTTHRCIPKPVVNVVILTNDFAYTSPNEVAIWGTIPTNPLITTNSCTDSHGNLIYLQFAPGTYHVNVSFSYIYSSTSYLYLQYIASAPNDCSSLEIAINDPKNTISTHTLDNTGNLTFSVDLTAQSPYGILRVVVIQSNGISNASLTLAINNT